MHELFHWDDDDRPCPKNIEVEPAPEVGVHEPLAPPPKSEGAFITFRDVYDGCVRTGNVLRTISSKEHANPHLGKLPVVTLYLVVFESERRKDDLAVIDASLIVRPPKPRP